MHTNKPFVSCYYGSLICMLPLTESKRVEEKFFLSHNSIHPRTSCPWPSYLISTLAIFIHPILWALIPQELDGYYRGQRFIMPRHCLLVATSTTHPCISVSLCPCLRCLVGLPCLLVEGVGCPAQLWTALLFSTVSGQVQRHLNCNHFHTPPVFSNLVLQASFPLTLRFTGSSSPWKSLIIWPSFCFCSCLTHLIFAAGLLNQPLLHVPRLYFSRTFHPAVTSMPSILLPLLIIHNVSFFVPLKVTCSLQEIKK